MGLSQVRPKVNRVFVTKVILEPWLDDGGTLTDELTNNSEMLEAKVSRAWGWYGYCSTLGSSGF